MTPRAKCHWGQFEPCLAGSESKEANPKRPGGFDMDQATRINHRAPRAAPVAHPRLLRSTRTTIYRASLPRGHTGRRGHTDTDRGYTGGTLNRNSLNRWTRPREIAISRHSSCRTSAWRQSSVPKPQAISQRQSPRREILSSSSSSPMPIYLVASSIRHSENVAPYMQLRSNHLSVTGYIGSFSVPMPSE